MGTASSACTSKFVSFRDFSAVDYTAGSWDDRAGLVNHQYLKRHRSLVADEIAPPEDEGEKLREKRRLFWKAE